jgi:hypothetical protein
MVSRKIKAPSEKHRTELISLGTGAPLEVHPNTDPSILLSADPHENDKLLREKWGADYDKKKKEQEAINHSDNFNYHADDQRRCPFASHIRKCGPRDDHPFYTKHLMLRRGIPYGELTKNDEKAGGVSQQERGLLFVSYQSNIKNGFHTVQKGMFPFLYTRSITLTTAIRMGEYRSRP